MPGPFQITYQGQPISTANQPQMVQLKSGEHFYFPVGWFLVKIPPQSVLQMLDANSGMWLDWDSGQAAAPVPINSDGTNFRISNVSGTISGVTFTNAGTLYSAGTTITFAAPVSGGVTATANAIVGGSLSLAIPAGSTGGTGYVKPTIYIPPPQLCGGVVGSCLPATATLGFSAGVINSETMGFAGAGYVSAPGNAVQTVTPAQFQQNYQQYANSNSMIIIDPAGTGATIAATVGGAGTLTGAVMTNGGSLYDGTHIPAVTITDPAGTGINAAATALPNMALTSVTLGGTNTGYSASVLGITSLGSGAAAIGTFNGQVAQPRRASFTCTESGGVLQAAIIEDAGIGFQTVPLAKQVGNATADGSVNATFVAVVGGVTNTVYFWQVG
jgi:hypothetical protein